MKRNSRLSLALHTLSHMAVEPDRVRTSVDIADHAGTNPVVLRRVLCLLRDAGLLTSETGHAGGWRLAKSPGSISLADVYPAKQLAKWALSPHRMRCGIFSIFASAGDMSGPNRSLETLLKFRSCSPLCCHSLRARGQGLPKFTVCALSTEPDEILPLRDRQRWHLNLFLRRLFSTGYAAKLCEFCRIAVLLTLLSRES